MTTRRWWALWCALALGMMVASFGRLSWYAISVASLAWMGGIVSALLFQSIRKGRGAFDG